MQKKVAFAYFTVLIVINLHGYGQEKITLPVLLREMADFTVVAKFPHPKYTLKQASSYDRRSIAADQPGWFANADFNQFIRKERNEGREEFVMMDADGPGAIVRFWLTTVVKPGILRFYFDNEKMASLKIPAFDLLKGFRLGPALLNPHSSYEPEGKGGNTLYLPLLYQKHCKVTWQCTDTAALNKPHYYQINYRTYAPGTKVETFAFKQLSRYKAAIDKAEALLWNPAPPSGKKTVLKQTLVKGETAGISLPGGANAVREIRALLTTDKKEDYEKMWRSVFLQITFDGHKTVLCPLGDFMGSGYGGKPVKSWYRELTDSGALTSRWVMPYKRTAMISFINKNEFEIHLNTVAITAPFNWDANTLYFHTTYKYEKNIKDAKWDYDVTKVAAKDPDAPVDWNFATIKGKGVYMGNTLSVNNHMNAWYGEGDAKAYVDNETFPSEFGTGLEDYYNTSWAPVVIYQTPFANAPRADNPSSEGYNTFTRTRILDALPFNKAFSFNMEMLSWDGGTIDAAATTYWYGLPGLDGQ